MNGEFCVRCAEKEAQMELLRKQLYEAQQENEKLALDLAFYQGNVTNLSCNEN